MPHSHPPSPRDGPASSNPYLNWAIATDFRYCRPGDWLPMLVQFDRSTFATEGRQTPLSAFKQLNWLSAESKGSVRIAEPFLRLPKFLEESSEVDFCVLYVRRADARAVTADKGWRATIAQVELGPPVTLGAQQTTPIKPASVLRARRSILMAVLDEGIAYAHERFRQGAKTRIEYLKLQDGNVELTAADINADLSAFTKNGRTDEARLYQSRKAIDFAVDGFKALARRRSHGTHVLDLAAGASSAAAPNNRPIVAVELPPAMVGDPSGTPLYAHIIMGLIDILKYAEALAGGRKLPVVVSLSYGPQHGPHDGTSLFETLLEQLIAGSKPSTPMTVVLAAGNFRQSRAHARFGLDPAKSLEVVWRLQPEDLTLNIVEFWVRAVDASPADVSVTLTSPDGPSITVSLAKLNDAFPAAPQAPIFSAQYEAATSSLNRSRISLITVPTATDPPLTVVPVAAPGRWTVRFDNRGTRRIEVEGWIARDGPIAGRRARGRQSYFDDRAYLRHDVTGRAFEFDPAGSSSYIRREGTFSGVATGPTPVVVGGFVRKPGLPDSPALYSSMGSASGASPSRMGPNALAPSDDSLTCRGILAAGTRSGSALAMNGTSVAAPLMARYIADEIAGGSPAAFPLPALNPPPPSVPVALVPKVVGAGCLAATPYPDTPLREQRP